MKRSLTIGCVLLVGGGVTNCGGSVTRSSSEEPESQAGASGSQEHPSQAGASGSGAAGAGFVGDVVPHYAGGGGQIGFIGNAVGSAPAIAGDSGVAGAGAPGWENGMDSCGGPSIGGAGGAGGEAGSSDEPPAVGTAPLAGAGGWIGIPAK